MLHLHKDVRRERCTRAHSVFVEATPKLHVPALTGFELLERRHRERQLPDLPLAGDLPPEDHLEELLLHYEIAGPTPALLALATVLAPAKEVAPRDIILLRHRFDVLAGVDLRSEHSLPSRLRCVFGRSCISCRGLSGGGCPC